MKHRHYGFTLPELLAIIVVIGILAGIVSVVWSGAATNSRNKAREADTRNWAGAFETYKSRYVVYPALPTADGTAGAQYICLGNFSKTSNKCGKYTSGTAGQYLSASASAATAILTGVAKTGKAPINTSPIVKNNYIGPFLWTYQSTNSGTGDITVTAKFINYFDKSCPSDFEDLTATSDTNLAKLFNGLSVAGGKACGFSKTLVYNPNS